MTSVTMPTLFNKACWKHLDSLAKRERKKKREQKKEHVCECQRRAAFTHFSAIGDHYRQLFKKMRD